MKARKIWSLDQARNVLIEKKRDENIFNLISLKIKVFQKFERTAKLLMSTSDLRKKGICSESAKKRSIGASFW